MRGLPASIVPFQQVIFYHCFENHYWGYIHLFFVRRVVGWSDGAG